MMEQLRTEQDKQTKLFEDKCKQYEAEKAYLVEDLKSKHRLDMESLKQQFTSNKDSLNTDKQLMQEKYEAEMKKIKVKL
jgi:hypothetical protein